TGIDDDEMHPSARSLSPTTAVTDSSTEVSVSVARARPADAMANEAVVQRDTTSSPRETATVVRVPPASTAYTRGTDAMRRRIRPPLSGARRPALGRVVIRAR